MISTKSVKDETKEFKSKFIAPGIQEAKVTNVTFTEPEGKSPYLTFSFENREGQTSDIKMYVSEAAQDRTMTKIKHLGTKVVDETALDAVTGKNYADFAKNLTRTIAGKWLRVKFSGEMVAGGIAEDGSKKNDWAKTAIGLPAFAEKLTTNPTKLKYDPTNRYDLKPLETADTEITSYTKNGVKTTDDFPF
jgi:hypothetical protein